MADDTKSDRDIKMEDAAGDTIKAADSKPSYKSWKKKYRKMRITFDQKMHDGQELYLQEQKAFETTNRIAVQIDRLLDLLLDVNQSNQIPFEKRFDLSLDPPSDSDAPRLSIDSQSDPTPDDQKPTKPLRHLIKSVSHLDYATTLSRTPDLVADVQGGIDSPAADPSHATQHPPSFLTADDIDNYILEIDTRLAAQARAQGRETPEPLPTLAHGAANGAARINGHKDSSGGGGGTRDFALRNPTSVYNWLRKHEPKVFLQDGESTPAGGGGGGENGEEGGGGSGHHHHTTHSGRGRRGGERGGSRTAQGSRSSKRAMAQARRRAADDGLDFLDDETSFEPRSAGGKRKRGGDDDGGYRPKGGTSRGSKKKRKSEGGEPPAKRARKSDGGGGEVEVGGGKED